MALGSRIGEDGRRRNELIEQQKVFAVNLRWVNKKKIPTEMGVTPVLLVHFLYCLNAFTLALMPMISMMPR